MKKIETTRKIEHNSYIGPTKSLQEVIEDGQAMGIDKALRARHPIQHLSAAHRKDDIYLKTKNERDEKEHSIQLEKENMKLYESIGRKANFESIIQYDKSKEENAQLNLIQQKLKRVKSDNALYSKNIERKTLENKLNDDDMREQKRLADKRHKEKEWIEKMSSIEQGRPY